MIQRATTAVRVDLHIFDLSPLGVSKTKPFSLMDLEGLYRPGSLHELGF